MQFLGTILSRVREWYLRVSGRSEIQPFVFESAGPLLYRDVSAQGVRVYSLCGACGARMQCSATLCEECAQGPHTSAF